MQHKLFSIILIIFLTTEITGQVVIKEKVDLTESVTGTGQQSIITQYYADIAVTIYWVPAIAKLVQINFHTDNIWTDTTSTIIGCDILCDDDHHSCFNIGQTSKWQRGQVKGTTVWFEVKECQSIAGHYQWVNIPYEIRPGSTVRDTLFVYKSSSGTTKWYFVGFIYRRDVVAPECTNADNCGCIPESPINNEPWSKNSYSNYFYGTCDGLPKVNLVSVQNGYDGADVCREDNTIAGFSPIEGDALQMYNLSVCFDPETQRWWFSVDNNNTFNFRYVLDYCIENITQSGGILINDYAGFPSWYTCSEIERDINNHKTYPVIISNHNSFLIKELIDMHESKHKADLEEIMQQMLPLYYEELLKDPVACALQSGEEARIYWTNRLNATIFDKYWENVLLEYEIKSRRIDRGGHKLPESEHMKYEDETNRLVRDFINDYYRKTALHSRGCS